MKKFLLACAVLLCSSVGGQAQNSALEGRTLWRGYVSFGFETSEFRPCGSKEQWWVLSTRDLSARYKKLSANMYSPVFVRLRGVPTKLGQYGHLGAYQRQFEVTAVLESRPPKSDDCKVKGS